MTDSNKIDFCLTEDQERLIEPHSVPSFLLHAMQSGNDKDYYDALYLLFNNAVKYGGLYKNNVAYFNLTRYEIADMKTNCRLTWIGANNQFLYNKSIYLMAMFEIEHEKYKIIFYTVIHI